MDSFSIGERAIVMADAPATVLKCEGQEVEVVGHITTNYWFGIRTDDTYPCLCPDGIVWDIAARFLRKKPPAAGRDQMGEWELCPWRPPIEATVGSSDSGEERP